MPRFFLLFSLLVATPLVSAGCRYRRANEPSPGVSYGKEEPPLDDARPLVTRDLGAVAEGQCSMDELVTASGATCKRVPGEQATGSEPTTSANAWDANPCTTWKGGSGAPFVAVDFGRAKTVTGVILVPETTPPIAEGKHVIESSDDGETWSLAYVVEGKMAASRAYSIPFQRPVTARYLRVTTQKSDGDVGWREITPVDCS
jgi:hypothetical protein